MFKEGNPISREQRELLGRILNIQDIMDVAEDIDVSYQTVRNIFYRHQSITKDNKVAAYKLVNKALAKSEESIAYFLKAKSELEAMLPKIHQD